jgi:cytochrome P450
MHDMKMLEPTFVSDPYAYCPALLEAPVQYSPELDAYLVTRYADVDAILQDTDQFSSSNTNVPIFPPADAAIDVLKAGDVYLPPNLINADPPRHTFVRRMVADAISPRRIRGLEPFLRQWVENAVDQIAARGHGNIYQEIGFPLPAITAFSLIGFPAEDTELLKSWCDRRVTLTYGRASEDEQVRVAESVAAFWEYTNRFIETRMANPVDDFTSDMVRHHFETPEEFTQRDIASVLFGMSLAAHETTTNLISNGVRRLMENREQWEKLVADPSLIPNAVEECLRYDTPVITWRRRAKQDIEIQGILIPENATIMMMFFSANWDPARFENPEVFDVVRKEARNHLTFGKGVHFCSGAPLARLEMKIVLENLVAKVPNMNIVPGQKFEFTPNIAMRGPNSLLVTV